MTSHQNISPKYLISLINASWTTIGFRVYVWAVAGLNLQIQPDVGGIIHTSITWSLKARKNPFYILQAKKSTNHLIYYASDTYQIDYEDITGYVDAIGKIVEEYLTSDLGEEDGSLQLGEVNRQNHSRPRRKTARPARFNDFFMGQGIND